MDKHKLASIPDRTVIIALTALVASLLLGVVIWFEPDQTTVKDLVPPLKAYGEEDRISYAWQQGEWFAIPLKYRNPRIIEKNIPVFLDREKLIKKLSKDWVEQTGYASDGKYDPSLIQGPEIWTSFSFNLPDISPVQHNVSYTPDVNDDPNDKLNSDIATARIIWAGGNAPKASEDVTREFDNLAERWGNSNALKKGHYNFSGFKHIAYDHSSKNYSIYEKFQGYQAELRCVMIYDRTDQPVPNPNCNGKIRHMESGVYIYVTFPESIIRLDNSWLAVAEPAFNLKETWRME